MALPSTAEEIYDLLVADEVVADALGTITLPGQDPMIAIGVYHGNERLPEGTAVDGVEIAILRNPGPSPDLLLTGETLLNTAYRLYVSQWTPDGNGAAGLWPVVRRIISLLPGATAVPIEAPGGRGNELGLLDQYAVRWTNVTAAIDAIGDGGSPVQENLVSRVIPRQFGIEDPQVGDDFIILRPSLNVRLAEVRVVLRHASVGATVTIEMRRGASVADAGTLMGSLTTSNVTTGVVITLPDPVVPQGQYVWMVITDISGTVGELALTIAI